MVQDGCLDVDGVSVMGVRGPGRRPALQWSSWRWDLYRRRNQELGLKDAAATDGPREDRWSHGLVSREGLIPASKVSMPSVKAAGVLPSQSRLDGNWEAEKDGLRV